MMIKVKVIWKFSCLSTTITSSAWEWLRWCCFMVHSIQSRDQQNFYFANTKKNYLINWFLDIYWKRNWNRHWIHRQYHSHQRTGWREGRNSARAATLNLFRKEYLKQFLPSIFKPSEFFLMWEVDLLFDFNVFLLLFRVGRTKKWYSITSFEVVDLLTKKLKTTYNKLKIKEKFSNEQAKIFATY